jgi:hypothetical protein
MFQRCLITQGFPILRVGKYKFVYFITLHILTEIKIMMMNAAFVALQLRVLKTSYKTSSLFIVLEYRHVPGSNLGLKNSYSN